MTNSLNENLINLYYPPVRTTTAQICLKSSKCSKIGKNLLTTPTLCIQTCLTPAPLKVQNTFQYLNSGSIASVAPQIASRATPSKSPEFVPQTDSASTL